MSSSSPWFPRPAAVALFTFAFLPAVSAQAQETKLSTVSPVSPAVSARAITVPITLDDVHVYVDATINGKSARLVLDSGAGGNVLTPAAAQRLGIILDDTRVRASGATSVSARRGSVEKLTVGDAVLENSLIYVIPLPAELSADGLLGYDFLARFIATLDYEKLTLTLSPSDSPDRAVTQAGTGATALPLTLIRNLPVVPAEADGIKGVFRLDTGAGDALTLFPLFVDHNRLRDRYPRRIKTATGKGVGGLLYGEALRLNSFKIGGVDFQRVPGELSKNGQGAFSDRDQAGNVGGQILRRFIVTFDYPGKRVFLRPNPAVALDAPFPVNRAGIAVSFDKGRYTVAAVIPDSPGAESGVKKGDTLLAIDGVAVEKLTPTIVRTSIRQAAGKTIELQVQTGTDVPRLARLTLRDLL